MAHRMSSFLFFGFVNFTPRRSINFSSFRCAAASGSWDGEKIPARMTRVHELMKESREASLSPRNEPIPKITKDHVSVNFARSSGPGGQNVNKVNTKVDMRFNVSKAYWLSSSVREKILQREKNRINKDGELVLCSMKFRTQHQNIEDALEKMQAIIDAAAYVPPPPSMDKLRKISKLVAADEQRRVAMKRANSQKKSLRSKKDWD